MRTLLTLLVGIAVFAYLIYPIIIRFSFKAKGRPRFKALEAAEIPDVLADYIYSTANALREDGFLPEAYLSLPDQVPNVAAFLIMLTNRATGDKAMVTAMMTFQPGKTPQIGTRYVEFSTRFVSGKAVDTLNSNTAGAFLPVAGETKTRLPQIPDPHTLYQIHRHVMENFASIEPGDEKTLYPEGGALPYLTDVLVKSYEAQMALGLFYRDEVYGETLFRPTWYGAFYMTWATLFPVREIRRMLARQRSDEILRSFRESRPVAL